MVQLIGFTGGMGCGKSTAIEVLKSVNNQIGGGFALVKFAGKLYEFQEHLYSEIEPIYKRPDDFVKDRKLLQWLGTEWGRGLDQDLWVKLWKHKASQALAVGHIVVCDDVRFDNEASLIHEMGGRLIHIKSNRAADRIDTKAGIANHASEAGVNPDLISATVWNDSTIEDYKDSLVRVYRALGVYGND